jgi:hypothetical protein
MVAVFYIAAFALGFAARNVSPKLVVCLMAALGALGLLWLGAGLPKPQSAEFSLLCIGLCLGGWSVGTILQRKQPDKATDEVGL